MTWHSIRLPGPWEIRHDLGSSTWRFRRAFHRPSGLLSEQRVDLVIESASTIENLSVNHDLLEHVDGPGPFRYRIDRILRARNLIEFVLVPPATQGEATERQSLISDPLSLVQVRLEIEDV